MIEQSPPAPPLPAHQSQVRIMGTRTATLGQAQGRLVLISLFFSLVYLVFVIRAFDVMIIQGALLDAQNDTNDQTSIISTVSSPRRDIVDRHGTILATSIKTASLYADPHLMIDPEATAQGLARIFPDQSVGDLLPKLQGDKRFVWIKRNISPKEQSAVLELGQPGLAFQEEYKRIYPHGALAAHVVGYSGVDAQGLAGIEKSFNTSLVKPGAPLMLTLDIRLQHTLRREIEKTITDFKASGGAGLVMDIKTGDVLALASLPDFDPHLTQKSQDANKFNRVTLGAYELGSTFKIFTTAALLEQQNPSLGTTYDTREPIKVGRFTISDFHPENRVQTIPEIFMHSSNIGTAMMAQQIGTENLKNFFDQLGFFKPIKFDLPEMGHPIVPKPWREVTTLTASYGHGIAISPLQLAAATATVIGDGTVVHPHLVAVDHQDKPLVVERIVSPATVAKMRAMLRLAVREGTGSKADIPQMMVGGKTGTSEKTINGRYDHNALLSSFVGAFPMDDPQYVVLVTIDDPKPNATSFGFATAGWTAAPAAGRVIAGLSRVLAIAPRAEAAPDPADLLVRYLADPKTPAATTVAAPTPVVQETIDASF